MACPNPFGTLKTLNGTHIHYYSLPHLEDEKIAPIQRLPVTFRILLESLLRHSDQVKEDDILNLARWSLQERHDAAEIPFTPSRVVLQDFTGIPLLVDLAAMRSAIKEKGGDPALIEPKNPVDLVIDHSVQVDRAGVADAFTFNLGIEVERNYERYSFLKWAEKGFKTLKIVPPGVGIVHQINLEYLATVVTVERRQNLDFIFPDSLVGTDSHTTMINGLGVLGWGVGGIEAESAMLGLPTYLQIPEVIGVHFSGRLQEGVTATDLTLKVTQMLRKEKVVGKFVEFFGEGAAHLTVEARSTISNMAPEYGATVGFFSADEKTLDYLRMTGRKEKEIALVKDYLVAQKLFGIPRKGEIDYTKTLELNLSEIVPCVSGPKRPQDHIELPALKEKFQKILKDPIAGDGYGKTEFPSIFVHAGGSFALNMPHDSGGKSRLDEEGDSWSEVEMVTNRPITEPVINPGYLEKISPDIILKHGSIVIAAITSCTNTSNPSVMIGAGLIAKKAVERGLNVNPMIKTSLAPGSRVVTDYLEKSGLQEYLDTLGFQLVAYGCTTCIGNSGPLDEHIEHAIKEHDLIVASVLSGNRNFEARVHSAVKANFLMSPPLVVALALAGRVDINLEIEPLGYDHKGRPVFLREIWPSSEEIDEALKEAIEPSMFQKRYENVLEACPWWNEIEMHEGPLYPWKKESTYIQKPPYFEEALLQPLGHKEMRALALFGDSVTTDHISPAGGFKADTAAGRYLLSLGVKERDFNSYGSRRGNHHVMVRGTFANPRLRNKMADGKEGSYTKLLPDGQVTSIFDASQIYIERKVPLIIFAGKDYGMGSSRDWAAKGTALLGVKVVVAQSFERIHRNNLIGMGVLPLQFLESHSYTTAGIQGDELFTLIGLEGPLKPQQEVFLEIKRGESKEQIPLLCRLDTMSEVDYFLCGGILPFTLKQFKI